MMNAPLPWTSSPSSSSAFVLGWHVASTVPRRLWDAYVAYLWYYQPNSWVGRLASTFRILAVILVLPVILLTLLDVTSYVIARTLGIVDDVKASTSDADTRNKIGVALPVSSSTTTGSYPSTTSTTSSSLSHSIRVDGSMGVSEGLMTEDSVERRTESDGDGHCCVSTATKNARARTMTIQSQSQIQTQIRVDQDASPQAYCFAGEEGSLRLAGEGVFSPAVSMPPSPLTPRMSLHTFNESDGKEVGQAGEEIVMRRRVRSAQEDGLGHTLHVSHF